MKKLLFTLLVISLFASSCRKCFVCTIIETDVNGQETGRTFKNKYCFDKKDKKTIDIYSNLTGCKDAL